jgi:hypothetical protein
MRRPLIIAVVAVALGAGTALEAQGRTRVSSGSSTVINSSCCAIGMFGPSVPAGSIGVQSGISGGAPHAFPVTRDFRHDGVRHDGQRHNRRFFGNSGYPIYYAPYAYGYYDDTANVDANPPANNANYEQPASDEGPGLTVFERRRTYDLIGDSKDQRQDDRYGEHYTDQREERATDETQQRRASEEATSKLDETVPTILIFRDGSHREIRNYALMGSSIYDLSVKPGQGRMKIMLADLDIPATIAANDQRGIEFKIPKQ